MANKRDLKKDINYVLGDIIEAVYVWEYTNTSKDTKKSEAVIDDAIEVFDDLGNLKSFAYARTKGSRTVGENLTLGQRRKVWIVMMEKIMNSLDAELDLNVRTYLKDYTS